MCSKHDICQCDSKHYQKDLLNSDSTNPDLPDDIVLSLSHRISNYHFDLPPTEFDDWVERQLEYMKHLMKEAALDHYARRAAEKDFPTEFTRP